MDSNAKPGRPGRSVSDLLRQIIILVPLLVLAQREANATVLLGTWEAEFELREQMVGAFLILYAGPDYTQFQFSTGINAFDPLQALTTTSLEGNGNWSHFAEKIHRTVRVFCLCSSYGALPQATSALLVARKFRGSLNHSGRLRV